MTGEPKPRNGESTKQFALRVGIVVLAIVVLAVVYGLFAGMIAVPPETQVQVWGGVGSLLTAAFVAAGIWIQARSARIGREEVAHQAELSRQNSDLNAAATRDRVAGTEQKVSTLIARVEDGLGGKIAEIVKGDAEKVAEALRIKVMEEENIALRAKLEALTMHAAPALVLPNGQAVPDPISVAIEANTRDTAAAVAEVAENTSPEAK